LFVVVDVLLLCISKKANRETARRSVLFSKLVIYNGCNCLSDQFATLTDKCCEESQRSVSSVTCDSRIGLTKPRATKSCHAAQLSQKDCAMFRVIKYFTKSLKY